MDRKAAINFARVGAQKIWAGTVSHPCQRQDRRAPSRRARERHLCACAARRACAGASTSNSSPRPGRAISSIVPPYVPHQEINASEDETLECVLVRSDNEAVVVNLDIEPVEKPEDVPWVDPIHKG